MGQGGDPGQLDNLSAWTDFGGIVESVQKWENLPTWLKLAWLAAQAGIRRGQEQARAESPEGRAARQAKWDAEQAELVKRLEFDNEWAQRTKGEVHVPAPASANPGNEGGHSEEAARVLNKAEWLKQEYEEAKRSHDGKAMSEANQALWELLQGVGEMKASQAEMEKVRDEINEMREAEHMAEIEIVEPREAD
jgi:hypothetical protein